MIKDKRVAIRSVGKTNMFDFVMVGDRLHRNDKTPRIGYTELTEASGKTMDENSRFVL